MAAFLLLSEHFHRIKIILKLKLDRYNDNMIEIHRLINTHKKYQILSNKSCFLYKYMIYWQHWQFSFSKRNITQPLVHKMKFNVKWFLSYFKSQIIFTGIRKFEILIRSNYQRRFFLSKIFQQYHYWRPCEHTIRLHIDLGARKHGFIILWRWWIIF